MNDSPLIRWWPAILVPVVLIGCGPQRPETIPVIGTVTLDGKPVSGAAVLLTPEEGGRPAHGVTDESGMFTLTTFESGDGALPGRHAVTVALTRITGILPESKDGVPGGITPGGIKTEWLIPQKYASPATSGLTVEVKRTKSRHDFDLNSH